MMVGENHDGIAEMIAKVRTQFPGHELTLAGTLDGYGDFARFWWTQASHGGEPVAAGTDVLRMDRAGRSPKVVGFLDGAAT